MANAARALLFHPGNDFDHLLLKGSQPALLNAGAGCILRLALNPDAFLLVEDNENDVILIRKALLKANVLNPLVVVRNAEEAIAYFMGIGAYKNRDEFPLPSLVLLDLRLPGMNGLDFLKWLREQPGFGTTRVVVLTGSTIGRDVNEAYQRGANSFLTKGDFERFVEIANALSGYWLWMDKAPETHRPSQTPKRTTPS
ncbi:MAG TPA: response regulator [Candidatus Limnocylindrales bacterium]|nr:response regulator [Candidatus Limnocylindrales bacterium]